MVKLLSVKGFLPRKLGANQLFVPRLTSGLFIPLQSAQGGKTRSVCLFLFTWQLRWMLLFINLRVEIASTHTNALTLTYGTCRPTHSHPDIHTHSHTQKHKTTHTRSLSHTHVVNLHSFTRSKKFPNCCPSGNNSVKANSHFAEPQPKPLSLFSLY